MRQLVVPNTNIPYIGGLCEGHVEGTVGQATLPTPRNPTTSGVYTTATAAWGANKGNHPGEQPPKGYSVAAYFKLGSTRNGHTAIVRPDGSVATSALPGYHNTSYIYPNLQAMINDYAKNNNGCEYLGWTEYIGNLRVIKGDEMDKPSNEQIDATISYLHYAYFGKPAPDAVFNSWRGLLNNNYTDGLQTIFENTDKNPDALKNKSSDGAEYEPVTVYRKIK